MDYDVIIAGAGPVGLFLANELRLAKLSVLVLEQQADPRSPLKRMPFGLRGLWGPSIEAFYRRGLLEAISPPARRDNGQPLPAATAQHKGPAGHFAGIQFDYANIDQSRWRYRLPGPSSMQFGVEMEQLETALTLDTEIRRGHAVERFEAIDDGVIVDGIRARYLVGCDGAHSKVRKLGGFEFVGSDPELTGYSVQVELADPAKLPVGRFYTPTGMYTQWQPGWVVVADFDGGAAHRKPITRESIQAVLRRVSGRDVEVTAVNLATTWTDRSYQATTYRNGRVLLAGDAAHIHSPLGGQGLNLGFGDAMNLGWKLAATIRGDAPAGLLDTYSAERHPLGARILDWTRAQVASMRPDRNSRALQAVLRDLIDTRDGATYFAERVWNVNLRYGDDAHPLVGRSCPDFELADGRRVGELLRAQRGLLLDFDNKLSPPKNVTHVPLDATDRLGLSAVLVRPDGFVAWATDGSPDRLADAAATWF